MAKEKKYHFITGLPRSGSTMLSSILLQNPRFHASITDSMALFVKGMIETMGGEPGMESEAPILRRIDTIRGMFDGYYKETKKEVVFNTNRGWTFLMPTMHQVYPNARYIVCVRDINWILNSLETAHRENPLTTNTVTGGIGQSVYDRVNSLMEEKSFVGFPYVGVKQAITSAEKHLLMLVEYDQLCSTPEFVMQAIYNFIDEPYYEHDFDNIERDWKKYDKEIGIELHNVKSKVKPIERTMILPPDIIQKYNGVEVWRL